MVLVIDSSKSMEANALIERVREAAHAFVDAKAATDQIAIVNFDGDVTVAEEFTTEEDRLHEAIDAIALEENTALWDGIVRSAHLYDDSTLQPNIIVFSDGADNASTATAEQAQAAVTAVGGTLFAIGVENSGFDQLAAVARATGGEAAVADDAEGVGAIFDEVQQTLRKQYVTEFVSETTDVSSIPITLTVGTASDTKEYVPGSNQQGAASLAPVAGRGAIWTRLLPVAGRSRPRHGPRGPRRRGDRVQRRQLVLRRRQEPAEGAVALRRGLRR